VKIAFIKQKYVPYGGAEGVLRRLMQACVARGHQTHLITGRWLADEPGIIVHPVRHARVTRSIRMHSFSRAAARLARAGGYDVVVSFDRTEFQHVWRAGEGIHRVWLQRRELFEPAWKVVLARVSPGQRAMLALEEAAVRVSRLIVTNSRLVAEDLRAVYGQEMAAKVRVIYNGVDPERFHAQGRNERRRQVRRALGCGREEVLLAFVGSGFRRKGLRELLSALRHLPEARLLVAGRDATRPWERTARDLGLADRVIFQPPRPDPADFYHAADVAVLPTWFDAFPNSTLEALACGTPVVTTRFSGSAEIIRPGVNGYVVERPDDDRALAEAVSAALELARHSSPEDIAATVAEMTTERCADQFLQAMGDLMEGI